ncbi:hypothetical protein BJ138DRAFT_1184627 [Hygrophoropsis aurantiaca]|uniref:Uncharacterized protein n=1 Tax=Hygrophoropsis aurantiaca TaxID=72124 RepID=A0ACB7ZQI3_9AGAM|nr:hypothetical protein BJ138DRAFT_1184627 [Hygrophoropsis aurantiaca]
MADLVLIQQLQMEQTTNYISGMVLNPLKQTLRKTTHHASPSVAGGALVVYNQVLTFSQEASIQDNRRMPYLLMILTQVDLVWNRNWSFTTVLYFIARYSGCLNMMGLVSQLDTFIVNMYLAASWASNIFILAMQAILLIRVYALFNRSKRILISLTTSYVLQATAIFVMAGLVENKQVYDNYDASIGPAIGSVMQSVNTNSSAAPFILTLTRDGMIISAIFDTILLFFALWAFVKHTAEAKALNGRWSINALVSTLVADHLLYFVCNLTWLSLPIATAYSTEVNVASGMLDNMFYVFNALVIVFGPRMVISLRTTENKTRGEGGTLEGEVSTIRFDIREPPTHLESIMEEGGGFRATDGSVHID